MKKMSIVSRSSQRQGGFLLLEVLITIVILAFGLLGLAGLQAKIQTSETESYQRTQALLLLQDMVNRVSANRIYAAAYVTANPLGSGDDQPTSCSGLTGVARDQCEWSHGLKGAAEKQTGTGTALGAMLGARGCVEQVAGSDPPVYRVAVAWQGMTQLSTSGLACGQNLYGAEGYRRAIAGFVPVANLSN